MAKPVFRSNDNQNAGISPTPSLRVGSFGGGNRLRGQTVVKAKNIKGTLLRLWSYFDKERKSLILIFVLTCLSAGIGLIGPYYIGRGIDVISQEGFFEKNELLLIAVSLAGVYVMYACITFLQGFIMAGISQSVVFQLRKGLFAKLQKLPLTFFDTKTHGELMSRLANDIDNISSTVATSTTQFMSGIIMIIGALLMMLILSPMLTLASVITLPLMFLLTRTLTGKTRPLFKEQQVNLGKLNGMIEESISGINVVKAFNREEQIINEFKEHNERLRQVGTKAIIWSGFLMPIMNVINNIGFTAIAYVGGYLALKSYITIGLIASFISYSKQFTRPLIALSNIYNTLQTAVAGAERVFEIMDEKEETEDINSAVELKNVNGAVSFKDVSFCYVPDTYVLEDINFFVPAGTTVALVGPTGAGKTTIINLLTRFYDASKGTIEIDGKDIRHYTRESLRKSFGIVLQDTYLFSGSVKDNIKYGKPDATDDEIIAAAKISNAYNFIEHLPKKYDTVLIESGRNLSQGQRQLLAITRAILCNHPILILDEATSSVDTRTEMHIQSAMINLKKGKTSFVIAHRLSTIKDADIIMVVDKGHIIEKGTHESLIALDGHYKQMYLNSIQSI